jgi:serine/threonine-protein kinase
MLEVEVDQADPLLGKVLLDRYRPVRLLGEGGMGRVYVAEQKMSTTTRKVAIKTLHPELSQDPQLVARFRRECETVIELTHPNTIQFYDFGELPDGTLFIVMEFVEGRSLASELEKGPLDLARIDKILIQVCGSLHEAHQRGIIHRDLKPDNILLTDRGGHTDFVKVLDFGIAKKDDADDPRKTKLTKQGMVLGTPPYMSPEQFSGKRLDARSDIYSLGVMVYEMLVGALPFDATTPWEWATKHLTAQPTPFEAHPGHERIPVHKKNAVMRALAKNPDQRPSTVLEFLQEFTGYQDPFAAWTMATSPGGSVVAGSPHARPPAPTPAPMPQFNAMASSQGSVPGAQVASQPSAVPVAPFAATVSLPGTAPSAGYATPHGMSTSPVGDASAAPSTSARRGSGGKLFAFATIGAASFVVLAIGGAGIWWAIESFAVTPGGSEPTPGSQLPPQPSMQPTPTTPTTPTAPTTPTTPTAPTTPTTPTAPTTPDAPTAQTPSQSPTEPDPRGTTATGDDGRSQPGKRGPSPADEARARSLVAVGQAALMRNDFIAATAALGEAQRLVGRRSPILRQFQEELDVRGSRQVLALLQAGRCPQAQQLFHNLRQVGATSGGRYFASDWCPRP